MGIMNKMKTVDLGTLNWRMGGTNNPYFAAILPSAPPFTQSGRTTIACDRYTVLGAMAGGTFDATSQDKIISKRANNTDIMIRDNDYSDAIDFKSAMSGVLLTYETVDSVEEKIVSNPRFTYTGARWAQEWTELKPYLSSLNPGTYKLWMRATLTSKTEAWDRGNNLFGIYLNPPPLNSIKYGWGNAEVGAVKEVSLNLTITQTTFNFYIYGCGIDGIGASGTADIELTIINPYTEEIL